MEEKKKTFIIEKIVGREVSRQLALRWLLLAAACGLVFGLVAAFTFSAVRRSELRAERESSAGQPLSNAADADKAGDGASQLSGEGTDAGQTGKEAGAKPGEGGNSPEHGQGGAAGGTAGSGEPSDTGNTELSGAAGAQGAGEKDTGEKAGLGAGQADAGELSAEELTEQVSLYMSDVMNGIEHHIAAVTAVSTNQTWFDGTAENAETFAGVVLSVQEQEILILTTDTAANAGERLMVSFADGTEKEAVMKQRSEKDHIAVLAVSKEGLGAEFIEGLSPVKLGIGTGMETGDPVIAAGAPLGKVHSYDTGIIGYQIEEAQTEDGHQQIFESNVAADALRGTFLFNLSGELIGIAEQETTEAAGKAHRFVSVSYLRGILAKLQQGEAYAYLGLIGQDISFDMQYSNIPKGMYVTDVALDSPAYLAGIKRGDIVTAIDDAQVESVQAYETAFRRLVPQQTVRLRVLRSGSNNEYREMQYTLTVGAR